MPTNLPGPSVLEHIIALTQEAAGTHSPDRASQPDLTTIPTRSGSASAELLKIRSQPKYALGAADAGEQDLLIANINDPKHSYLSDPSAAQDLWDVNVNDPQRSTYTLGPFATRDMSNVTTIALKRSYRSGSFAARDPSDVNVNDLDRNQEPATKIFRDGPRTRYHQRPGFPGIPRGQSLMESRRKFPIVHHSALRTSSPDARATSRAGILAPEPPSCQECPETWSTGLGHNPFASYEKDKEEISHSAPLYPCSYVEKHNNNPYYVCASCRVRASKHRTRHFKSLVRHPRALGLCDHCATFGVAAVAKPEHLDGNGNLKQFGCICGQNWMCCECGLTELHLAKAVYDDEWLRRRAPIGTKTLGGEKFVWIGNHCICGYRLKGNEKGWKCTSCGGIGFLMV
ncbi:MAG: hypothetical protein Q9170_000955 [Blastenia crenularia]